MHREPIGKALEVLSWIANNSSDHLSVRQIARDLGTTPSTVHRILTTFEEHRLLGRSNDGQYVVDLELYRICQSIAGDLSPTHIVMPYLEELAAECGEATVFGVYDPRQRRMMFSARVEAAHPLRYVTELLRWLPVHSGASGLAILAFRPPEERRLIYAEGLESLTPATLVTPAEIETELTRIRAQGYAHSVGQRTPGAVCFAAPVFESQDQACGDLCVTLPEQRFQAGEFEKSLVAMLLPAARRASEALRRAGYRSSRPALGPMGLPQRRAVSDNRDSRARTTVTRVQSPEL